MGERLILAPGETGDEILELKVTTYKGFDRSGYIDAVDPQIQAQRRIGWDARQAEIDALRKRVAELEVEVDRTIIAAGDMSRQGYFACEVDMVAWLERKRGLSVLVTDVKKGEHRGAATRKDDDQ